MADTLTKAGMRPGANNSLLTEPEYEAAHRITTYPFHDRLLVGAARRILGADVRIPEHMAGQDKLLTNIRNLDKATRWCAWATWAMPTLEKNFAIALHNMPGTRLDQRQLLAIYERNAHPLSGKFKVNEAVLIASAGEPVPVVGPHEVAAVEPSRDIKVVVDPSLIAPELDDRIGMELVATPRGYEVRATGQSIPGLTTTDSEVVVSVSPSVTKARVDHPGSATWIEGVDDVDVDSSSGRSITVLNAKKNTKVRAKGGEVRFMGFHHHITFTGRSSDIVFEMASSDLPPDIRNPGGTVRGKCTDMETGAPFEGLEQSAAAPRSRTAGRAAKILSLFRG